MSLKVEAYDGLRLHRRTVTVEGYEVRGNAWKEATLNDQWRAARITWRDPFPQTINMARALIQVLERSILLAVELDLEYPEGTEIGGAR